ncbi:MFS general substrate transporter [Sistotremastrum suecicum HHB10207 ss-3]|uniref:MFS general substrate transporter n=1 Tax=Sistotremastrum suecicum HHB10207 ss-3 TaxID=1314776 RepID=A0A165XVV3_9AGAM|nr:MFS general substrate transporter [Sistotremastrum suecicum HHB10207 ss-3]
MESDPLLAKSLQSGNEEVGDTVEVKRKDKGTSLEDPMALTGRRRFCILLGIWIAVFLGVSQRSLPIHSKFSISHEFQNANQASWLGTAFLLSICSSTPLYGRLCNVMGRKAATQSALLCLGGGVLMSGLSPDMEILTIARFISGVGAGGIVTIGGVVTSDMYSLRNRSFVQGIIALSSGLGLGLANPIGGLLSDQLGWRWAFLIQIPFFAIAFFLIQLNLNYASPGESSSVAAMMKRIDYIGASTLLLALGAFLATLSFKFNDEHPWSHHLVLTSGAITAVVAVLFFVNEIYWANEPIMTPFLLTMRIPLLVGLANFLYALAAFQMFFYIPVWFEIVRGHTSSEAGERSFRTIDVCILMKGVHMTANGLAMAAGSMFAGVIIRRTGKASVIGHIFGGLPSLAVLMLPFTEESSSCAWIVSSLIPQGFGGAVIMQTTLISLLASIPQSATAVAVGFGQLFRGVGQVFGVASGAAIFQSIIDRELRARIIGPGADELIHRMKKSHRVVNELPPDIQQLARDAYAIAIKWVFVASTILVFISFLLRLGVSGTFLFLLLSLHVKSYAQGACLERKNKTLTVVDFRSLKDHWTTMQKGLQRQMKRTSLHHRHTPTLHTKWYQQVPPPFQKIPRFQ